MGGWRNKYRVLDPERSMERVKYIPDAPPPLRYEEGLPVDASDVLADGSRFDDVRTFKRLLLVNRIRSHGRSPKSSWFTRPGHRSTFADRAEVDRIVATTQEKDNGFRSIIHGVIQSPLFQTR